MLFINVPLCQYLGRPSQRSAVSAQSQPTALGTCGQPGKLMVSSYMVYSLMACWWGGALIYSVNIDMFNDALPV